MEAHARRTDWWTQARLLRDWLSPTLRSREQRALRLLKIE